MGRRGGSIKRVASHVPTMSFKAQASATERAEAFPGFKQSAVLARQAYRALLHHHNSVCRWVAGSQRFSRWWCCEMMPVQASERQERLASGNWEHQRTASAAIHLSTTTFTP